MNPADELAYWIIEREAMRLRKLAAPPLLEFGYSANQFMGQVRYCNVHREDDKVTMWLAKHWRPKHHRVWEILLARLLNRIASLDLVLTKWGFEDFEHLAFILRDLRRAGMPIFSNAYLVSTCGKSMEKLDYVVSLVKAAALADASVFHHVSYARLETAYEGLTLLDGVGSFLAGQIVADLKHTAGHSLQSAPDFATWACHGPGSLAGLEAFYGRPSSPSKFTADIQVCWNQVRPLLPAYVLPIDMQDFQNCLCEFSKYTRVKRGGKAKNSYHAGRD